MVSYQMRDCLDWRDGGICRAIFENSPHSMAILNENGVFIEANPAMIRNLGINPVGKTLYDILPAESAERKMQRIREVLKEDKTVSIRSIRKMEDSKELFTTIFPIEVNKKKYCVVIEREISDIVMVNRLLEVINGINKLMVYEKEPKVLLDRACKLLSSLEEYYSVWIGLKREDYVELVSYHGKSGLHPKKLKDLECIWLAEEKGEVVKLNPEMRKKICPYYTSHKNIHCMIFPMAVEKSVIGFIIIHSLKGLPVSELLQTLANDLAFALKAIESEKEKIRAYRQIEENIENYAILVDQIRNHLNIISGTAELKVSDVEAKRTLLDEVDKIDEVIRRLDKGWLESEEIRKFLKMDNLRREIENMLEEMECPMGLRCYGARGLGKGIDNRGTLINVVDREVQFECLEKEAVKCPFSVLSENLHLCKCPIRVYIAKKLSL